MENHAIGVLAAAVIAAAGLVMPAFAQDAVPVPAPQAAPTKQLGIGDAAPALAGVTWLKGEPVSALQKGQVYVVEFWATWCGPCRTAIPHLTSLQEKYKDKLTIIGVSAWERAADSAQRIAVARQFADGQGPAMGYRVASDADGEMVNTWMEPAGRRSIPTSFVVDGEGRIAWIGSPARGLDQVLEKVIAGGFDAKAEAIAAAEAAKATAIKSELFAKAGLLENQNKHDEAIKLLDELLLLETNTGARAIVHRNRFRMMMKIDAKLGRQLGESLLAGDVKDNAFVLYAMAESALRMDTATAPDFELALKMAKRAHELDVPEGRVTTLDTLAFALFKTGDVDGAIETAEKALAEVAAAGASTDKGAQVRINERLEMYRKAKG